MTPLFTVAIHHNFSHSISFKYILTRYIKRSVCKTSNQGYPGGMLCSSSSSASVREVIGSRSRRH